MIKFIFLLVTSLLLLVTFPNSAVLALCTQTSTDPRVDNGLISTGGTVSNQFSSTTGICATGSSTIFSLTSLTKQFGYDILKQTYYNQAKSSSTVLKHVALPGGQTQSAIKFDGSQNHLYLVSGDLDITGNLLSSTNTGVVFVEGNLNIKANYPYGSSSTGTVFVTKEDIIIDPTVTQINAFLISNGTIYTAGASCTTSSVSSGSNKLTVNGSLISLSSDKPIKFCRKLTDNSQPAEKIIFQPKYLVILKDLMAKTDNIIVE